MTEVLIERFKIEDNYTLGDCYVSDTKGCMNHIGVSLERGWLNNKSNISCVPEGTYKLKLEYSPRFDKFLWELYGVPKRSECKFHAANYWRQLNGCIALGEKHVDIDGDSDLDITKSKKTMKAFHKAMRGEEATVTIKNL